MSYRTIFLFSIIAHFFIAGCSCDSTSSPISSVGRNLLIQGAVEVTEDVTGISASDAWPFTVGVAICENNVPKYMICGGTLIHPEVVVTAAHCVKKDNETPMYLPSAMCIIHSTNNSNMTQALLDPSNFTVITPNDMVYNPNYRQYYAGQEFHITGDIALMFLSSPILQPARPDSWIATRTSNPGYALLPNPNQKWDNKNFNFFAVAIGWGITENATETSTLGDPEPQRLDKERVALQVLLSREDCQQPLFYGMKDQANDTYCGAWFGGFDALFNQQNESYPSLVCRGDSGGGVVIPGSIVENFNFQGEVLIGIVSSGPPCPVDEAKLAGRVYPAEFTIVADYVNWIHAEMIQRDLAPLAVATSPLKKAWKDQTCLPGNCYTEDVMKGVLKNDTGANPVPTSSSSSVLTMRIPVLVAMLFYAFF